MRNAPDHRPADLQLTRHGLSSLGDLDDALIVRAANDAAVDATPADAGHGDQPLSRAERRGARRSRAGRRPRSGPGGRSAPPVPIKRPVKRGRDPRLPRR